MTPVVLASQSPRRRELLAAILPSFDVAVSDIPEPLSGDPLADAANLARAKAEVVAARFPGAVVIGADTIVFDADRSYGKPTDPADAVAMLSGLSGREHTVASGISVISQAGSDVDVSCSVVALRSLLPDEIAASVAAGTPMDKAGGYAIQDPVLVPVAALHGCYCGVMGLPLWRLRRLLADAGVDASEPALARCLDCPERKLR